MAAVARGVDEMCNTVHLNGFLGKHVVFSKCNFTCVLVFFSICQCIFLAYYFSVLNIFQGFSLNFARNLGRAVDKLLHGSRVNSHGQFIFGKQA